VFNDEAEFHSQLIKLLTVTKVPVILTMRENKELKDYLKSQMMEMGIVSDIVKYRYLRVNKAELAFAIKTIYLLEGFISRAITIDECEFNQYSILEASIADSIADDLSSLDVSLNEIINQLHLRLNCIKTMP